MIFLSREIQRPRSSSSFHLGSLRTAIFIIKGTKGGVTREKAIHDDSLQSRLEVLRAARFVQECYP